MRDFYAGFIQFSNWIYMLMVTNVLFVVANLPLVVIVAVTELRNTWLIAIAASVTVAPAAAAAFAVFEEITVSGTVTVVRTLVREYRRLFRRAVAAGAVAAGILAILAVDVAFVYGERIGAAAIPIFTTLIVLTAATAVHVVASFSLDVALRRVALWKVCAYLAIRKWYLTGLTLVALYLLVLFASSEPAWALGLAVAPVLYLTWANAKFALKPVIVDINKSLVSS